MRRRDIVLGMGSIMSGRAAEHPMLEQGISLLRQSADAGEVHAATLYTGMAGRTHRFGFGRARSPEEVFLIASITKPMTAAGVMVLADRGELALDDPVQKFIPEFSEGDRKLVTMRHLLTHSSGLPDMLPENVELRRRQAPLQEFVKGAIRTPLLFKPGTRVQYQSMGILLAAEVARRITGQPFPEFLDSQVFGPLGMKHTALGLGKFRIEDAARCQVENAEPLYGGGSKDTAKWDWNSPYWRNLAAPWGGAHSNGPDIARFLGYFLEPDGRVLKPATAAAMIVNQTEGLNEPRGIGFVVKPGSFGSRCSIKTFGHGGSTGTLAWADPQTKTVCVVLTTLPARVSNAKLLKPVSDRVSEWAAAPRSMPLHR
ncbi:MAG TPA: serine hydrolase domain-containing protein [Bryobacteraceae bacterium]|nr:serine hydrolase domain-containing protein [Bryobacteraceae bacterium]